MSDWIDGLPPAAHQRIAHQRASGIAGSLLSAPAAAALQAAGLAPAGEVFGCLVQHLGWTGGVCGVWGGGITNNSPMSAWQGYETPILVSGDRRTGQGFSPYVRAYEAAWHGALGRMLAEARALGADGVVGVRIGRTWLDGRSWEFSALGTAVRSTDPTLVPPGADAPWAAEIGAEDCAAAILAGLVPRGIAFGLSVATKHEDWNLRNQRTSWVNTEVDALTGLVQAARHDARHQVTADALRHGGGDLVVSRIGVSEFETPCGQEQDVNAEAVVIGTVLGAGPHRAAARRPAAPLTVLPLTDATARTASRRF